MLDINHSASRHMAVAIILTCIVFTPLEAFAKSKPCGSLPEPYVSPALDAVLMPITRDVVAQFALPTSASGAVIVSVEPGGIADIYVRQ